MKYNVTLKNKVQKTLKKLPSQAQDLFEDLLIDLEENGPIQKG